MNVADIARQAFDGVASAVDGVVKDATIRRDKVADYDVATGDVSTVGTAQSCRVVFGAPGSGQKYYPELVIAPPDEIAFIEGAAAKPPKENDILFVKDGENWHITQPPRDVVQGGGLWIAVVRPS